MNSYLLNNEIAELIDLISHVKMLISKTEEKFAWSSAALAGLCQMGYWDPLTVVTVAPNDVNTGVLLWQGTLRGPGPGTQLSCFLQQAVLRELHWFHVSHVS